MTYPFFQAQTIDDLMYQVTNDLLSKGKPIRPTKGPAVELTGILLELKNPRARLSQTETRGKALSCLGELCWYLAKTNCLDYISYYIPKYKIFADNGLIFGGYGPRLFDWKGLNQVENIIDRLKTKPYSRKAVIQLFDAKDITEEHGDIPCTCTIQFMVRSSKLHMIIYMRSNDVFWGFPHDIFFFTMLQEIIARTLSVKLGSYKHIVGSLHLYDKNKKDAEQFINEGWQSTKIPMPPMPKGDPWPAINILLKSESAIRNGDIFDDSILDNVDPYWADLIRLLQVFRFHRDKKPDKIRSLRQEMSSEIYFPFIDNKLRKI